MLVALVIVVGVVIAKRNRPSPAIQPPQQPFPIQQPVPANMDPTGRFDRTLELRCTLDADRAMPRMVPQLLVLGFAVFLLTALPLGLMVPDVAAVSLVGGIVVAAIVCTAKFVTTRNRLRHTYGQVQRLVLHPGGMRKVDASVVVDMPWSGLHRFEHRNSALPASRGVRGANPMAGAANAALAHAHTVLAWGIVGHGTVSPAPGASRRVLKVHDRLGNSNLRHGQPHSSPNCLVFPGEFEQDWTGGEIGAWLRHHRPDLALPAL